MNGNDIIELGFKRGPIIKEMLEVGLRMLGDGIKEEYVKGYLKTLIPAEIVKISKYSSPVECKEAIMAVSEHEKSNLESVRRKMRELLVTPVIKRASILPDSCPAGNEEAVIPVGGAIEVENAIIPGAHSADICCSMYCSFFRSDLPVKDLMDKLQQSTRFGAGGRAKSGYVKHEVNDEPVWSNPFLKGLEEYALKHMADQGDGNHHSYLGYIKVTEKLNNRIPELRVGEEVLALVTHHGSRGLGAQLYKRGIATAIEMTAKIADNIPKAAAWIDYSTREGKDYWDALQYVARWTRANHESIHNIFLTKIKTGSIATLHNQHNFVWKRGDSFFHGKGATPAWKENGVGLLGLIPLNMAREILIVEGLDNDNFLSFAPHGAGRNMSRTELFNSFPSERAREDEIIRSTKGLDIRWYCGKADVSETPTAYKDASAVKEQIKGFGLATVLAEIHPLGCIMAGASNYSRGRKPKRG